MSARYSVFYGQDRKPPVQCRSVGNSPVAQDWYGSCQQSRQTGCEFARGRLVRLREGHNQPR